MKDFTYNSNTRRGFGSYAGVAGGVPDAARPDRVAFIPLLQGSIAPDGSYRLRDRGRSAIAPGRYAVTVMPPKPRYEVDPQTTDIRRLDAPDPAL